MLIFTNRLLTQSPTDAALSGAYTPFSLALNTVQVARTGHTPPQWKVSAPTSMVADDAAIAMLAEVLKGSKPVLVFIHGNNNTPADCFTRCQALEDQFGVAVVGYSWASEGYQPDGSDLAAMVSGGPGTDTGEESLSGITKDNLKEGWIQSKARRYAQAKVNAQHSTASLARFFRLLAAARVTSVAQPFSVLVHSLGCHFLHYMVDHEAAAASVSLAQNIVLAAGCTGAAKHAGWVTQLNPRGRVYLTFTQADSVLAAARIVDGDIKLGCDPGPDRIVNAKYRYIDFQGAFKMKLGAHRYFVADPGKTLSKQATRLFKNIFSSQEDFSSPDDLKKVYPVGCRVDGTVCYMGAGASEPDSHG